MLFTSSKQKSKTWLIIIGILLAITIIIITIFGIRNIFRIILFLIESAVFIAIILGIAYLFYYLFIKKHRYDVTYINKKKLIDAGKKCNLQNLKDLHISGDKGHTRVHIGKIIGYCRIQVLAKNYEYEETTDEETGEKYQKIKTRKNERGEETPQYEIKGEEQDIFIIKPKGLLSIFSEPMVIRVSPEEHDELIGDVTLYGYSLIPISEYWFLNTDYLDVRKIDYAILKESERGVFFEGLRDMKEIVDKAVGLDARHKKGIEEKHLVEIPELQRVQK